MGMFDELLDSDKSYNRATQIPGIVTGIVKENWDEQYKGQLKVEYNLGEEGKNLTGWVPVMTPYGGAEYGMYFLPEVGSEVVLGFVMGDRNCPVVLGNIWSNKMAPPSDTPVEENTKKQILTKGGIQILATEEKDKEELLIKLLEKLSISMNAENQVIQIGDQEQKNMIELDAKNGKITIKAENSIEILAGSKASLKLDGSGGSVEISGEKISGTANQSLELKSQSTMKLESSLSAELSGDSTVTVKSSGTTKVSGTMVQIN